MNYAIINLKTDPALKKAAAQTAKKLGISLSAVLNNELRRFISQQNVVFDTPITPKTAKIIEEMRAEVARGDTYGPFDIDEAEAFLDNNSLESLGLDGEDKS